MVRTRSSTLRLEADGMENKNTLKHKQQYFACPSHVAPLSQVMSDDSSSTNSKSSEDSGDACENNKIRQNTAKNSRSASERRTFSLLRTLIHTSIIVFWVVVLCLFVCWYLNTKYVNPMIEQISYDRDENEVTGYMRYCDGHDVTASSVEGITLNTDENDPSDYNKDLTDIIMTHGSSIIPGVLSPSTANTLRDAILTMEKSQKLEDQFYLPQHNHRWSLSMGPNEKLDTKNAVQLAMHEIASHDTLRTAMENILGPDPAMIEMTTITSEPGAVDQDWHYDTWGGGSFIRYARGFAPTYSLFLVLQDTSAEMGATGICPGTHMCDWNSVVDGDIDPWACFPVEATAGSALFYNSQFAHIGHGNTAFDHPDPTRAIFVTTWMSRPRPHTDPRSLPWGLTYANRWNNWGHTLNDFLTAKESKWNALHSLGITRDGEHSGWSLLLGHLGVMLTDGAEFWYFKDLVWGEMLIKVLAFHLAFLCLYGVLFSNRGTFKPIRRHLSFQAISAICIVGALLAFDQTEWAQLIATGKRFRYINFHHTPSPALTPPNAMVLTEEPESTDIAFSDRYDAYYLFQNSFFLDYHPGNREFRLIVDELANEYAQLRHEPRTIKDALIQLNVLDPLTEQKRMFVRKDDRNAWIVMSQEEKYEQTRMALFNSKYKVLKVISKEVDYILSQCKYADGGRGNSRVRVNANTAMMKYYAPIRVLELKALFYAEHDVDDVHGKKLTASIMKAQKKKSLTLDTTVEKGFATFEQQQTKATRFKNLSRLYGVEQVVRNGENLVESVVREMHQYMKMMASAAYDEEHEHYELTEEITEKCRNMHETCAIWSAQGECENNPDFMVLGCAPSCRACHEMKFHGSIYYLNAMAEAGHDENYEEAAHDENYEEVAHDGDYE